MAEVILDHRLLDLPTPIVGTDTQERAVTMAQTRVRAGLAKKVGIYKLVAIVESEVQVSYAKD